MPLVRNLAFSTAILAAFAHAQGPSNADPQTIAESSGFTKTSTFADVVAFLDKLKTMPQARRIRVVKRSKTEQGKELPLAIVSEPPLADTKAVMQSGKLRLLVIGNIHGGEVEGKEAVQILLREIAKGEHADLLEHAVLLFLPIYNADGNDRISVRNRATQNGPDGGVGVRHNAKRYDLNRDFIKLDCPETKLLFGIWNEFDPHLFMDLHTTNGSYHGYHLTYAPSLSPNVEPALRDFVRKTFLPQVREQTKARHGFRVYDYGNFGRRRRGGGDAMRAWRTYDHRPRFGTNCYGLRNRIAVLSEAYSYLAYKDRIRVTRAFVLENLRTAVKHRGRIKELCAAADQAATSGRGDFGYRTRLEDAWEGEILVGQVERKRLEGIGWRYMAKPDFTKHKAMIQTAFVSGAKVKLPKAWGIPKAPAKVLEVLRLHGIRIEQLKEPREVRAEVFEIESLRKRSRAFQRHYEVTIRGAYKAKTVTLPKGTWLVSARQPLARLAAQDLEAVSEDSLATWNYFDDLLEQREDGSWPDFPVLRVLGRKKGL